MKSKEQLLDTIAYLKSVNPETITVDEETVAVDYDKQQHNNQSLIIKILIIIGGFLTCLLITGFLLLIGLYDSPVGMIILGLIAIGIVTYLSTFPHEIFLDTFLLSTYCVGYCLLGAGLYANNLTIIPILSIIILISAVTLFITRNYIISFISLLLVFGCFYFVIKELNIPYTQALYTSLIAVLYTYILLKEVKFLSTEKKFIQLYEPLKIALLLTFIFLLSVDKYGTMFANVDPEQWALYYKIPPLTSIVIFALFIYVLSILCKTLDIKDKKQQILLYIGSILVLLPTCYEPTISGSLLIMFTCFLVNYRTGFVIAVLAFLYFIIAFYYDMNVSLLSKSISLIVSGLLFFGIYFITSKKLALDEKK